jgi:tetratricopeptide (TPR) repeat protein
VSSSRGKYWREAGRVFDERPWTGSGAGNFPASRLRHRTDVAITRHAHGFVPQTMADLGILGLLVTSALLAAWLVAAARTTALHPRRLPFRRAKGEPAPRRDWDGQRMALVGLALTALVFGIHSAIDWTWFVPGPTAIGLVAAGFVAGRGPLERDELPAPLSPRSGRPSTARILAAAGVGLAVLLACWTIWQPEASHRATERALELGDRGEVNDAIAATEDAEDSNPLSAEPLLIRAAVQSDAGRVDEARRTLERAVLRFPGDAETWLRLAGFHLAQERPREAAQVLLGAAYLDPKSPVVRQLALEVNAALSARQRPER